MALPVYKTTPIRVPHPESGIPDARTLLEEARDKDCLRIRKQLKTHSVVQRAEGKAKRKVNTLMTTVRRPDSDNPREGHPRMLMNRKRKIHGAIRKEETVYNINIATRETPDGLRCGVEIEVGQHQT